MSYVIYDVITQLYYKKAESWSQTLDEADLLTADEAAKVLLKSHDLDLTLKHIEEEEEEEEITVEAKIKGCHWHKDPVDPKDPGQVEILANLICPEDCRVPKGPSIRDLRVSYTVLKKTRTRKVVE